MIITIFFSWLVQHMMSCSRLLPLQSLKEILTYKKQTLPVSTLPLRYAMWSLEIPEIHSAVSLQSTGTVVLDT